MRIAGVGIALALVPLLARAADDADMQACKTAQDARGAAACQRILAANPLAEDRELTARRYLGEHYIDLGQIDLGIQELTRVIQFDPKDATAYSDRAFGYSVKKDFAKAFADLDAAMKLAPANVEAFFVRCSLYIGRHQLDQALPDCDKAASLKPTPDTLLRRGFVRFGLQQDDAALSDFDDVIRRDPKNVPALGFRGLVYSRKHDYDHAIADHKAAAEMAPENDMVLQDLSMDYLFSHRDNDAIAEFDALVRQAPNVAAPYFYRAEVYERAGRPMARVIADTTTAIRLAPNVAQYYWVRGLDFEKMSEFGKAADDFGDAARLDANKPLYLAQRCADLAKANKYLDAALGDCDTALKQDHKNWEALSGRGFVELRMKRYAPALADFNARIERQIPTEKSPTDLAMELLTGPPPYIKGSILTVSLAEAYCGRALAKKGLHDPAGADADFAAADKADSDVAKSCRRLFATP